MLHKFNKRGYKNIKRNENKKIKIINNIKKPRFNIQKRKYSFKFHKYFNYRNNNIGDDFNNNK